MTLERVWQISTLTSNKIILKVQRNLNPNVVGKRILLQILFFLNVKPR